jgi:hypothetical protein
MDVTTVAALPVDHATDAYAQVWHLRGSWRWDVGKGVFHKHFMAHSELLYKVSQRGPCKLWKSCGRSEMERY